MKNKKKIIILIAVLVIAIALITFGVLYSSKKDETPDNKTTETEEVTEQEIPTGEGGDSSPEEFYNWETNLYIRASEIIDSTFKNKYTLDENGEFNITFAQIESKYGADLSEFNTETINCDLTNSTLKVTRNGEDYQKEILLSCTNNG